MFLLLTMLVVIGFISMEKKFEDVMTVLYQIRNENEARTKLLSKLYDILNERR